MNIYNEENLTPLTIQSSFTKKQRASIDTCLLIHATSYGPTLQTQVGWFKLREVVDKLKKHAVHSYDIGLMLRINFLSCLALSETRRPLYENCIELCGCILTHVVYQGRPSLTFREEGERWSGLVD